MFVVIGGLISATILTLIVLPVLYVLFEQSSERHWPFVRLRRSSGASGRDTASQQHPLPQRPAYEAVAESKRARMSWVHPARSLSRRPRLRCAGTCLFSNLQPRRARSREVPPRQVQAPG